MSGDLEEKTGGDKGMIPSGDAKVIPGGDAKAISGRKVILLQPTRGFRLRLSINHVIPGIILLVSGIATLREEGFRLLALAEIIVGAAVPTAILIEYLRPAHGEEEAVGWVEVLAGLMLGVEGAHIRHPGRIIQPALLYFILAVITLAFAFGSARRHPRLRRMTLDERGFFLRISPVRRVEAEWAAIAGYETTADAIRLVMRGGGRRTVRLRSIENRAELLREFEEFARRYGVGTVDPDGSSER